MNYSILIGVRGSDPIVRTFTALCDRSALGKATGLAKAATRDGMAQIRHDVVVLWRGPIAESDTTDDDYGGRYIAIRGSVWDKREAWDLNRRFQEV